MGQLLNIVAYVAGLEADGADIQKDYVLKKRSYLTVRAQALADFGNVLIEKNLWKSRPADHCNFETIVETNLAKRPELLKLIEKKEEGAKRGEEFSVLIAEPRDLCRENYSSDEENAFEDIMNPYLSAIFAAGFSHELRLSPLKRTRTPKSTEHMYRASEKIFQKMLGADINSMDTDDLDRLQRDLLAHTSAANEALQSFLRRLIEKRKVS